MGAALRARPTPAKDPSSRLESLFLLFELGGPPGSGCVGCGSSCRFGHCPLYRAATRSRCRASTRLLCIEPTASVRPGYSSLPLYVMGRLYPPRLVGRLTSEGRYAIQVGKRPGRVGRLHSSLDLLCNLVGDGVCHGGHEVFQGVHRNVRFPFRRRRASRLGFANELSEASCTSEDAEVLITGALSLRVYTCVASVRTIATASSPQTAPIQFRTKSLKVRLTMTWDEGSSLSDS